MATKQAFTREQLVELAGWLQEEPKLTYLVGAAAEERGRRFL